MRGTIAGWTGCMLLAAGFAWAEPTKNVGAKAEAPSPADLAAHREWPEAPKYHLPCPARVTLPVYQGNFGAATHMRDVFNYYAFDFGMSIRDTICAARSGKVYMVYDTGKTQGDKGNQIEIQHEDGELSVYAHILTGSALVQRGDQVQAGQPIALCGDMLHVHFVAWEKGHLRSVPSGFFEVKERSGVPLDGRTYTSQNPLITPKTIREGSARLGLAEGLLVGRKSSQAIAVLNGLAASELILGNDRRRASELLASLGKEAGAALAAAQSLANAAKWKEAKAGIGDLLRNYAGLRVCQEAKAALKDLEKREHEAAVQAARGSGE